jgi:DNA-binding NarL/FixJ family response regulator
LVGEGRSNKQIAASLNLSVKTIETYREHIKYKLGLASGTELVHQACLAAQANAPSASL